MMMITKRKIEQADSTLLPRTITSQPYRLHLNVQNMRNNFLDHFLVVVTISLHFILHVT